MRLCGCHSTFPSSQIPSSVKWRLSQDLVKYFREQCFPDHPNKNTNLLIIHLFFPVLFFPITATFVCLGNQNKSPQTGWLKQQIFVFPLFWKLQVQDQQVWLLLRPDCSPHCVLTGLSSWFILVCPDFLLYFIGIEFALQCCVSFCCTMWTSHLCTYIPSLLSLPTTSPPISPL